MNPNTSYKQLSDEALEMLHSIGWHPERFIDIQSYVLNYGTIESKVPEYVLEFLKLFGDIELEICMGTYCRTLSTNVDEICSSESKQQVIFFSSYDREPLYPIGFFSDNILLMNNNGRVYGGYHQTNARIYWGNTGIEALDAILTGKGFPEEF